MMDFAFWQWMKEEPTVQFFSQTVGLTYQQALPADPQRYALIVPNGFASNLMLILGDTASTPTAMVLGAATDINILTWEMVGGGVQLPLWARQSGGSTTLSFTTFSWNAQRFGVYRRMMDDYVSRYGAS